ncbi:hypothetical protein AGOR_G00095460 [Albula goreensis]|uniref:Uncharacterized protein n=1 Tax=Albula goreensis TaxID=1534307 RepID=A0A8T3DKX9_9TELE|nr:hypothetical protein AGOR_G00095460 [Albula goreensis]
MTSGIPEISNNSSCSGKVPHTSAASRLKHLQQSSPEKSKTGKQREDFLKIQGQQQGQHGSRSSSSSLSEARSITFSSRLLSSALPSSTTVFAPDLKKYSQEGVLSSSLPACSSSAKALLTNLSASSLSTEALLSSTLCQRLVREHCTSSNPLPVSSGHYPPTATTTASSPNFTSPSTSPSSPSHLTSLTLCSLGIKPTNRTLQFSGLNSFKEHSSKTMPKPVSPGSTQ